MPAILKKGRLVVQTAVICRIDANAVLLELFAMLSILLSGINTL